MDRAVDVDATNPRWSPDGSRIAFVRRRGAGGAPDSVLVERPRPWTIWVADARSGSARQIWKSPETLRGSVPGTHGGTNLNYAAGGRIAFLSEMDGWPHLYSVSENGGEAMLLTPGKYMAEYVTLSPDGRWLAFAGNAGSDADDIDRRHVVRVPVDRAAPEVMTPGLVSVDAGVHERRQRARLHRCDGAAAAASGCAAQGSRSYGSAPTEFRPIIRPRNS
jgi:dipeptidyl aminopeptidase/acylaminoacyl peptidase